MRRWLLLMLSGIIAFGSSLSLSAQWRDISPDGLVHHLRSVSFVDAMNGYASGWIEYQDGSVQSVIARTTDGGDVWLFQGIDDVEINAMAFIDINNGFLAGRSPGCDCPLILRTDDGGISWITSQFTGLTGSFRGVDFYDEKYGAIGGGNPQTSEGFVVAVEITPDGDEMAVVFQEELAHVSRLVMVSGDEVVMNGGEVEGSENTLYRVTNIAAGNPDDSEWEKLHTFAYDDVLITGIDVLDQETIYASLTVLDGGNFGGVIEKSGDGGVTWEVAFNSTSTTLVGLDFLDVDHGIATGGGAIVMTEDGGTSWSETMMSPGQFGIWVEYVASDVAYIVGTSGTILKYSPASGVDDARERGQGGAEVVIAPSPALSQIRITVIDAEKNNDYVLEIFDLSGRQVDGMTLSEGYGTVDIHGMATGTYFYRIHGHDGQVATGQFIVR